MDVIPALFSIFLWNHSICFFYFWCYHSHILWVFLCYQSNSFCVIVVITAIISVLLIFYHSNNFCGMDVMSLQLTLCFVDVITAILFVFLMISQQYFLFFGFDYSNIFLSYWCYLVMFFVIVMGSQHLFVFWCYYSLFYVFGFCYQSNSISVIVVLTAIFSVLLSFYHSNIFCGMDVFTATFSLFLMLSKQYSLYFCLSQHFTLC